jgi:hypothetical protein
MDVLQRKADLNKPIQDLVLGKVGPVLGLNTPGQVTAVSIVHYDTQLPAFSLVYLPELDDVWVIQGF